MAYRVVLNISKPEAELLKRMFDYALSDEAGEEFLEDADYEKRVIQSLNRDIARQLDAEKARKA